MLSQVEIESLFNTLVCRGCGALIRRVRGPRPAQPGDFLLCGDCLELQVIAADYSLRALTAAEAQEFERRHRAEFQYSLRRIRLEGAERN